MRARYPRTRDGSLPIDPRHNSLEIFTPFAYLAARTTRLRLHSGILVLAYRNPVVTAKLAATVDYLSGGRLTLGIGVGWMQDEFEILGAAWSERGRITDEY